jgi:hypothetical protein
MDLIHLTHDRDQWHAAVNVAGNLGLHKKAINSLTNGNTTSF